MTYFSIGFIENYFQRTFISHFDVIFYCYQTSTIQFITNFDVDLFYFEQLF